MFPCQRTFSPALTKIRATIKVIEEEKFMFEKQKAKLKSEIGSMYSTLKENNVIIAGGAITSIFTDREINDFDIYFRNREDLLSFYLTIKEDCHILGTTDKTFTFTDNKKIFQAIHFDVFEDAQRVFDSFDFSINMGAYDFKTESFVLDDNFLMDNAARRLVVKGKTSFPVVSLLRVDKYKKKGYFISKKEMLKLALLISELNFSDWKEFKSHFTGMYGSTVDVVFGEESIGEFSFDKALEIIENYENSDYSKGFELKYDIDDEMIFLLGKDEIPISKINEKHYVVIKDNIKEIDVGFVEKLGDRVKFINPKDVFPKYLYKYVNKADGVYRSRYKNSFIYEIGKDVQAEKGLYFTQKENVKDYGYPWCSNHNQVMIKVSYDIDDIIDISGIQFVVKKCHVIEEVKDETLH